MRNWKKWQAGQAERSARASRAARARWDRVRAARAHEPCRETRVVLIEIRDSHRPRTSLRLEAAVQERGWGRWAVFENGRRVSCRRFGCSSLADMLARALR